jgi:hypothetical protein
MKGQLIPFVFMILLVATVIIGYIFYNTFYGTNYQLQIFNTRVIDAVRNLIEDFKNYLKLSLTYSSHQALREHACESGLIGAEAWICNGPGPVEVEQSKACLEVYTKYYLSVYTTFFNTSLPVAVSKVNSTQVVYGVNKEDVFSGKYDEGNFWVNSSGAKIAISATNINEYEGVDMNDFITKDRYWYLFRNFYDWAEADVYSPCVCSKVGCACGSSSSGEEVCGTTCDAQAHECAQKALDDLQRRFDKYVKCDMIEGCCAQGVGPPCGSPCGCQPWENNICASGCRHNCNQPPPPGDICPVGATGFSANAEYSTSSNPYSNTNSKISFSADDICTCHYEARLAAGYRYWCIDTKYNVPSDKGPVPLKFVAYASAFFRDPCRCCGACTCPGCGC